MKPLFPKQQQQNTKVDSSRGMAHISPSTCPSSHENTGIMLNKKPEAKSLPKGKVPRRSDAAAGAGKAAHNQQEKQETFFKSLNN